MKKILFITMLSISVHMLYGAKACFCGDFANGIVMYNVSGEGCCSSKPVEGSAANITTYVENEGVWELVDKEQITTQNGQDRCCN